MGLPSVRGRTRPVARAAELASLQVKQSNLRLGLRYIDPHLLNPPKRAIRKHTQRGIKEIAASIEEFGFLSPIVIDADGRIVVGHGRWLAAKILKLAVVPVIDVGHLTGEQLRVYAISDNRLSESSSWNLEQLRVELEDLSTLDVDLALTAFSVKERSLLLAAYRDADGSGATASGSHLDIPRTQEGDVWLLGRHKLICASATDPETYDRLLGSEKAHMVYAGDPPDAFAVQPDGLGALAAIMGSGGGETDQSVVRTLLATSMRLLAQNSTDHAIHFHVSRLERLLDVLAAGQECYGELLNMVISASSNPQAGKLYSRQYVPLIVWRKSPSERRSGTLPLPKRRGRTDLWGSARRPARDSAPGEGFGDDGVPENLIADALRDCSRRGDVLLAPFGDAASLLAAEETGRCARLIVPDPHACRSMIERWQMRTSSSATRTGLKSLQAARSAPIDFVVHFQDAACDRDDAEVGPCK